MRRVLVPRQLIAAVMGGALLAGCSGLGAVPIADPNPTDVMDFTATFENYTHRRIETAEDYVYAGYAYVDNQCQTFFNALESARKDGVFAKESLNSAGALTNQILTLLKESQTSIGIVSGAFAFATAGIDRYNNLYNFAEYSPSLWQHVMTAQNNYKSTDAAPTLIPIATLSISSAATFYQAHQIVQGYARLCSLPQIEYFIHTALTNSKTQAADSTKTTSGGGAESASIIHRRPRLMRLPVYEAR